MSLTAPISRLYRAVVAVALVFVLPALAHAQLTARLEPDTGVVGSTITYAVTVKLNTNGAINPPTMPTFDPNWGLSSPTLNGHTEDSTQIMIGPSGSTMSRNVTFQFSFTAAKEGTFNIGPSTLQANGQTLRSNPVTLRITKMPAAANVPAQLAGLIAPPTVPNDPQLAQKLTGAIFVLPVVTNPNPYNGEQIRVSFHLCIDAQAIQKAGLSGDRMTLSDVKTPTMNDFLKEEIFPLPRDIKFREQVIGGRTFQVAPLYEVALSSTKTGKVVIDPFQVSILFGSRSRDPFNDEFFNNNPLFSGMDPFMLGRSVPVIAQSRPHEINVKPLPTEGKPANFSGAVGDFKVTAVPDRDKLKANEDVLKVTLAIEGQGDASAIKPPALPAMPGFTQLGDPKSNVTGRKENDDYISTRKIDYILRPTQPGNIEIPPVQLSAFNPKTQSYENLESNPVQVKVEPGSQPATVLQAPAAAPTATAPATGNPANPAAPQETDLRYIHTGALAIAEPGLLSGEGPLFGVALAVPPLLLAAGYLLGRRRSAEPEARASRSKRAGERARKHLRQVEKLANSSDRSNFFAETARSLRTYFGNKFGVEPTGITIEQIATELDSRGASAETVTLAERLLEQCDAARYSPVQPDADTARRVYDEALDLINRVERKA